MNYTVVHEFNMYNSKCTPPPHEVCPIWWSTGSCSTWMVTHLHTHVHKHTHQENKLNSTLKRLQGILFMCIHASRLVSEQKSTLWNDLYHTSPHHIPNSDTYSLLMRRLSPYCQGHCCAPYHRSPFVLVELPMELFIGGIEYISEYKLILSLDKHTQ